MLWTIISIVIIVAAWYWYEGRWDRRLFGNRNGVISENLRPQAAKQLLDSNPETQVLDVRSANEVAGGTLPKARHISIGDPAFASRLAELDKTKPVLVYCAGGFRSRKAVEVLLAQGFQSIHHLHRGYHSWKLAGLPIVTSSAS